MKKGHRYLLAGLLTAVGLALAAYKIAVLDFPLVPGARTALWSVEACRAILSEVREQSADTDSLVIGLLNRLNRSPAGDNLALLLGKNATVSKKTEIAVQLLALEGIHARAAHGTQLEEQRRNAAVINWLEIYQRDRWIAYDPA
jgi:hypothetical protein